MTAVDPQRRAGRGDALDALRRERFTTTLRALFGASDPAIADALLRLGEWARFPRGERLFAEGDPGDSMYVLVAGRLAVACDDAAGRTRVVGQVRPGETVGEMGLLATQPRTATVRASRDSVVVRISEPVFRRVAAEHPQLVAGAARVIIRRATELMRGEVPTERVKSVAVVPLRPTVAAADFVERLARALAPHGSTLVVDEARAAAALAAKGVTAASRTEARDLVFSTWIDEAELRHDAVVYTTEGPDHPWTERCVRQADVVLMLAPADAASEVDAGERALEASDGDGRRELVLIHRPGAGAPALTARWTAHRAIARHHHVRWDHDGDFRRLARLLSGNAVGLVLGGGGARGFTHLGVVRALREAGIPIDAVGGTSQGAVVAACVAMDWDDARIERLHRTFTRRNPIGDYTLVPHVALAKGQRLEAVLQRCFGATDIEDAWLPFFCVSANLTRSRLDVHRAGPIWRALRASVSIPGLLPPVVIGEDLHVDGALLDNLPVAAMRAGGVRHVIAVDLTVERELRMTRGDLPTTLDFLKERLRPGGTHPPSPDLGSILVKSVMLSSVRHARAIAADVDLYLAPEPADVGFLEWSALDRAVALGYAYARRELARSEVAHRLEPREARLH